MFDIKTKAVAETAECLLEDVDGSPLIGEGGKRCSITMFGPASKQFAEMRAAQKARTFEQVTKRGAASITAESDSKFTAEDLARCTKSLNNFDYPGEFENDHAKFVALYSDHSIGFVRDQANNFFGDWGNYSGASKKK